MVVEEQKPVCWRREEDAGDVFGSFVVFHSEQPRRPFEVILLREFRSVLEGDVVAFVGTSFEHQQSQFVLLAKHQFGHALHPLLIVGSLRVEVDVHAHGVAHSGCALKRAVGVGQT